jgi:hypothetical protein
MKEWKDIDPEDQLKILNEVAALVDEYNSNDDIPSTELDAKVLQIAMTWDMDGEELWDAYSNELERVLDERQNRGW